MRDIKTYLAPLKDDIKENWPSSRDGMNLFYIKCWGARKTKLGVGGVGDDRME